VIGANIQGATILTEALAQERRKAQPRSTYFLCCGPVWPDCERRSELTTS
jgi:hypothetical protein